MPKHRALKITAGIAASFAGFVAVIVFLMMARKISFEMGLLMFVALLGLYVGFGILIAVYRLIQRME